MLEEIKGGYAMEDDVEQKDVELMEQTNMYPLKFKNSYNNKY